MRRLLLFCVASCALVLAAGASAQPPVLQPSVAVDGPSADLGSLSGLSVSRDGSGGLAYLKAVAGIEHVFVARLVSGVFQQPEQIDTGLGSSSSQPVIAVGDNGLVLIAFVNGGQLYTVTRPSTPAPYGAPQAIASGASNPAIAVSIHAKGYLAFTVTGDGGHDVRTAFYNAGQWALESSPLDAVPADDAGVGTGRPRVAAAGDGVAIVVWGEAGHVYSRRVWGTAPSVVFEQADVPTLAGWNELAAEMPDVAAGDDSSYGYVVFRELLASGSSQQSRVLMRTLRGSRYDSVVSPDGVSTPGLEGAAQPRIALSEYDDGFVTSARDSSQQVYAKRLGNGGEAQVLTRVDSLQNASSPDAVPAATGAFSGLVAWQHDPGPSGPTEIRARFYDGTSFGPELVASTPGLGATNAAAGLAAAGDFGGDVAIAWVQGSGASTSIVAALLYSPPGSFAARSTQKYLTTTTPVLAWSPAPERWGPIRYQVAVDGVQVGQTTGTSSPLPSSLPNGPHSWQVTAVNQAGIATAAVASSIFVDTFAPSVQLMLTGAERTGALLHLGVRDTDTPPPVPGGTGSGIASVLLKWGDGTSAQIRDRATHRYRSAGRYRLTLRVTDRAGNTTTLTRSLRIAAGG